MNKDFENIEIYLKEIKDISLEDTEHRHRGALENFLKAIAFNKLEIQNEPNRDKEGGAPDFLVLKDSLILGYIETKRLGSSLDKISQSSQIKKYLKLSDNIILSDYLSFYLIAPDSKGEPEIIKTARICELNELKIINNKKLISLLAEGCKNLLELFELFFSHSPKSICNALDFASALATRTRIFCDFLITCHNETKILAIYNIFKKTLYENLDFSEFCDSFSQTLVYSLFLAKLNLDNDLNANEKLDLYNVTKFIPQSFPLIKGLSEFLNKLNEFDEIKWLLKEIISIINHIDTSSIIAQLNEMTRKDDKDEGLNILHKDPYLHFYETFLSKYNPTLRELRGVYYTPLAVVNFIINAISDILVSEFSYLEGLSNALKKDSPITLLDFATGTGTFLLEAFRKALDKIDLSLSDYEISRLIERFYGFEYLIAPYIITHLKLSQTLKEEFDYEIGKNNKDERLKVYLSNTLEEIEIGKKSSQGRDALDLFNELVEESVFAQEAKDKEILIITGNPPYSGASSNKNIYEDEVREAYSKEPGTEKNGKAQSLKNEKNPKWLLDDYVKFIRFGESKIEKQSNGGIFAFISNNSFIDNPTFRGMRYHLLNSFDKLYILNLHGNSRKKEKSPDGSKDENVFDIMQGVSINIFIKNPKIHLKDAEKSIFYYDLYGKRKDKYSFLFANSLKSIPWQSFSPKLPFCLFIPQDESLREEYEKGWSVKDIFRLSGVGICSKRDHIVFQNSKEDLLELLNDFATKPKKELYQKYSIGEDSRDWKIDNAILAIKENIDNLEDFIMPCCYRPFDFRWTYYINKSRAFMAYPVYDIFEHFIQNDNIGLIYSRRFTNTESAHGFTTDKIIDLRSWTSPGMEGGDYISPLYLKKTKSKKSKKMTDGGGGGIKDLYSKMMKKILLMEKIGLKILLENLEPLSMRNTILTLALKKSLAISMRCYFIRIIEKNTLIF